MAAAAFKGVIKLATQSGQTIQYPVTVSDVAGAYAVFPDGNNDVVLPSNMGTLWIVDVILSAAGTDTSRMDIYVNGKSTGEQVLNTANLATGVNRQFLGSPVGGIAAGARMRLTQIA